MANGVRVCLLRKPSVPGVNVHISLYKAIFVSENLRFSSPELLSITGYDMSWHSLKVSPHPVCMDSVILMSIKRFLGTRYLRFVISNDSLFCSAMCFDNELFITLLLSKLSQRICLCEWKGYLKLSKTLIFVGKTNENNIKNCPHFLFYWQVIWQFHRIFIRSNDLARPSIALPLPPNMHPLYKRNSGGMSSWLFRSFWTLGNSCIDINGWQVAEHPYITSKNNR